MPKVPSAADNTDGTPKIVFHGARSVFDTFSYGHIGYSTGVGILGDGFYFTDKKNLAKNYGREIYPVYLKMNNPYMASQSDAYKLNTAQLEAQGYDGVILEAPAGNVYMVFNNTQIKSATDNIGTFDGTNPNIKRSARSQQNATVGDVLKQENEQMKQYLSDKPGRLGGHRKLKIYGKLDCASAKRHIANGDYIRHRVFFADEETAVAAGYRPCGVSMKKKYQAQKSIRPN